MKRLANGDPITNLKISVAASLLPLAILGVPKLTGVSHKVRSDSTRANHLAQIAQYHSARACYRIDSFQSLTKGDIIPNPAETACYQVFVADQPVQLAYVVKNPETGLVQVASVFTPKELANELSILKQP
jgi:hypothetical protein